MPAGALHAAKTRLILVRRPAATCVAKHYRGRCRGISAKHAAKSNLTVPRCIVAAFPATQMHRAHWRIRVRAAVYAAKSRLTIPCRVVAALSIACRRRGGRTGDADPRIGPSRCGPLPRSGKQLMGLLLLWHSCRNQWRSHTLAGSLAALEPAEARLTVVRWLPTAG